MQYNINYNINTVIMHLVEGYIFGEAWIKNLGLCISLINGQASLIHMHTYLSTMSSKCDVTQIGWKSSIICSSGSFFIWVRVGEVVRQLTGPHVHVPCLIRTILHLQAVRTNNYIEIITISITINRMILSDNGLILLTEWQNSIWRVRTT